MFSKIISSKTSKKIVSLLIVLSCIVSLSLLTNAATTHSETISFGSNHARGYSNAKYYVDVSNSSGFKTKCMEVVNIGTGRCGGQGFCGFRAVGL